MRCVLGKNTPPSFLYGGGIVRIDDETTFASLADLLPLDAHASESFRFVPRSASLAEVAEISVPAMEKADRIGVVFITHSGKSSEKVLGIVRLGHCSVPIAFEIGQQQANGVCPLRIRRYQLEQERTFDKQHEREWTEIEGSDELERTRRKRDRLRQRNSRLCRKYGLKSRRERKK